MLHQMQDGIGYAYSILQDVILKICNVRQHAKTAQSIIIMDKSFDIARQYPW